MMNLIRWQDEVRDPATAAAGPLTVIKMTGCRSRAAYETARIPTGWAERCEWSHHDNTGGGTAWAGPYPTLDDAIEAIKKHLSWALRDHPLMLSGIRAIGTQETLL